MSEYRSTERVYGKDANGDDLFLLYAVGDVIPEEEAKRQGLTGGKAVKPSEVEDKAVKPAAKKTAAAKPAPTQEG